MDNTPDIISDEVNNFENFFDYMLKFNQESKGKLMNVIQYFSIALIPIVILLKLVKNYFPEEDNSKGSIEILVEVIGQLTVIFLGILFIDRFVRYFPTISKMNYHIFNETNFIIPILIILVTMQTKLGSKINILTDRLLEMWNGKSNITPQNNNIKVTQPIAGKLNNLPSDNLDVLESFTNQPIDKSVTMINNLPIQQTNNPPPNNPPSDYNNMMFNNEPMAANDAFGSGFGTQF